MWSGRDRIRASRAAYPSASKVSGAPLRSRSPRRTSSTSARWNPSSGTTTPSYAAATAAASVDLPAPGAPLIPSRNRRPGGGTSAASSRPSGERGIREGVIDVHYAGSRNPYRLALPDPHTYPEGI